MYKDLNNAKLLKRLQAGTTARVLAIEHGQCHEQTIRVRARTHKGRAPWMLKCKSCGSSYSSETLYRRFCSPRCRATLGSAEQVYKHVLAHDTARGRVGTISKGEIARYTKQGLVPVRKNKYRGFSTDNIEWKEYGA